MRGGDFTLARSTSNSLRADSVSPIWTSAIPFRAEYCTRTCSSSSASATMCSAMVIFCLSVKSGPATSR